MENIYTPDTRDTSRTHTIEITPVRRAYPPPQLPQVPVRRPSILLSVYVHFVVPYCVLPRGSTKLWREKLALTRRIPGARQRAAGERKFRIAKRQRAWKSRRRTRFQREQAGQPLPLPPPEHTRTQDGDISCVNLILGTLPR